MLNYPISIVKLKILRPISGAHPCTPAYINSPAQGRTDPMGIRAMPWGPPPKGTHHTFKKNANEIKCLRKKGNFHLTTEETLSQGRLWAPLARIYHKFLRIIGKERFPKTFPSRS